MRSLEPAGGASSSKDHTLVPNRAPASRQFCLLPQKRCWPISLWAHRKILPLRRRGAARGRLRFRTTRLLEMKTKQVQSNSKLGLGRIFRRSSRRHDPLLVLNMALFKFTDGWNRAFSRDQYARFSV